MNKAAKYLAIALSFVIISSGMLIAACMDMYESDSALFFFALIPLVILFMGGVVVNERLAVPRLLLKNRFPAYCATMFATAYVIIILALGYEYVGRLWWGLPQRLNDVQSKWIIIDCLGNCTLVFIMYLGLGAWQLYVSWQNQTARERQAASNLSVYMKEVKERLNPSFILGRITLIRESIQENAGEAVAAIRELSGYLRCQLYDLPAPPGAFPVCGESMDYSVFSGFIAGDRWRVWRHVIFQAMLLIIVFDVFFDAPDRPVFSFDRLMGMLAELALLDIIAYVNIIFLYRDFKRHHDLKKYLKNVAVLIIAVLVPLVVFQALTIKPSLYTRGTPVLLVLGTLSSMTTLSMFVAGISAALLLQDWISGQQRVTMLQAETVRQEYAFLKKQINPHFLFNVLNNVGILSEDEPAEASGMLAELQKLVEYQFSETDNNNTTLRREIEFLSSYLALEGTRIEPFSYEITSDGNVDEVVVPTLLFIPFVENAVKYGSVVDGRRDLKVSFSRSGDFLEFQCENTFRPRSARSGRPGGLGISNTLRRLNLLFGDKYSYSRETGSGRYKAYLRIPLKNLSGKEL